MMKKTKIEIRCSNGHAFELDVDVRDYLGLSPDARHRGVRCPTCEARLSVAISAIRAAVEDGRTIESVEAEGTRRTVDPPHPDYRQPVSERAPESPETPRRNPTAAEIAARRAAGPGNGGL